MTGSNNNDEGVDAVAAAAIDVAEQAKWDAYDSTVKARLAKLPKRDRRDLSRASEQTKWVMELVTECWSFQQGSAVRGLGFPTENVLHRAGLLIPRAPLRVASPELKDIPARVRDGVAAIGQLLESRQRVLWGNERYGEYGTEYTARKLHMSPNAYQRYLKQARQSVADIMRGKGYAVPQATESERVL